MGRPIILVLPLALAGLLVAACSSESGAGDDGSAPEGPSASNGASGGPASSSGGPGSSQDGGGPNGPGAVGPGATFAALETDQKSGTRLQARFFTTAEGYRAFAGWYDGQLKIACTFGVADDGVTRCLPVRTAYIASYMHAGTTCSGSILAVGPKACSASGYATGTVQSLGSIDRSTCPARVPVTALGPEITGATSGSSSSCVDGKTFLGPGDAPYPLGAKVDATTFVRAKRATVSLGGGLEAAYLEGDDGSRGFLELRDTQHGVACEPFSTAAGVRCLPKKTVLGDDAKVTRPPLGSYFADAACGSKLDLYGGFEVCSGERKFFRASDACNQPSDGVWSATAVTTGNIWYRTSGGACAATTVGSGAHTVQGPSVAPAEFPAVTAADPAKTGRLVPKAVKAGSALSTSGFQDTDRNETCTPRRAADGVVRCLPQAMAAQAYFEDAACTQRIVFASGACAPKYFEVDDACRSGARIHQVGTSATGGNYYSLTQLGCLPMGAAAPFLRVGAEIPGASFAALTE